MRPPPMYMGFLWVWPDNPAGPFLTHATRLQTMAAETLRPV